MKSYDIVGAYFPVVLLVMGLIFGIFVNRNNRPFAENYMRWFLFFSVGIMGLWAGLFQALEPERIAASIGWANSPFLFEIACVNIGFGVAGVLAPKFGRDYWLSITIVQSIFLWGAAYGHIREIFASQDLAIDNAGPILYTDILIPIILWVLLGLNYCSLCRTSKN